MRISEGSLGENAVDVGAGLECLENDDVDDDDDGRDCGYLSR